MRQLLRRHLEWPRPRTLAGSRLRVSGGPGGVEGDVALHFLHDLVDVSVQYRDGAKAAQLAEQRLRIAGAPAPGLVNVPEWHVREDHDGGARAAPLEVRL